MPKIQGTITSGLGEGKLFLSMGQYNAQIVKKLGFAPFEGTLNIKVNGQEKHEYFKSGNIIIIDGFKTENRNFGKVYCILSEINGIKGAAINPEKTAHKDIVEFIAPISLRKELKLKDGDKVTVKTIEF